MSIEKLPAYILEGKTMRRATVTPFGDEVIGHVVYIDKKPPNPLVPYHPNYPTYSPQEGGSLVGDTLREVAWLESTNREDLIAGYDVTQPAKYPITLSVLRGQTSAVSKN